MPVRIRLSRGGAKKRPFYRIIVADSRRSRDGKFIDQIGTYNPMLAKENPDRIKVNADKAKDWIAKGAQPSDRVKLFLSNIGIVEKPIITEKTKKHLPKKKAKEDKEVTKQPEAKAGETAEAEAAKQPEAKAGETAEAEAAKKSISKNLPKDKSDKPKDKKEDEEKAS